MAELPYMPVHVADAIADAEGLTNEELGALVRVRWALWRAGGLIAEAKVARFARTGKRWGAVSPAVLDRLQFYGGKASCAVVTAMLVLTRERRAKRSQAGAKGAAARLSGGTQNSGSEGILNGRKPLRFQDVPVDLLGPGIKQTLSNHNQNRENHRSTSAADAREQHDALYRDGVALLRARTGVAPAAAKKEVSRWLGLLDGDSVKLTELIGEVDRRGLTGHSFGRWITEAAERLARERTKGLSLPLGPTPIKAAGGGRC